MNLSLYLILKKIRNLMINFYFLIQIIHFVKRFYIVFVKKMKRTNHHLFHRKEIYLLFSF